MEEANSSEPTTLLFKEEEGDILKDCSELMKMSNIHVSSQPQYDKLRSSFEVCNGHHYGLKQDVEYYKKMLAQAEKKLKHVDEAISLSSKQVDKNNLEFNGSIVSNYSSGRQRKEKRIRPSKSQRKSAKNQTGSYKSRYLFLTGKKGGRTRKNKK